MAKSSSNGVEWDLSVLFNSETDPAIDELINKALDDAKSLEKYKGKIKLKSFSVKRLSNLLTKYESIIQAIDDLKLYSELTVYSNQSNKEAKAVMSKYGATDAEIKKRLSFIKLELGDLLRKKPSMPFKAELRPFKHFLEKLQKSSPFQLSEAEEKIILEKSLYGVNEWSKLRNTLLATKKFKITIDGEEKEVTWGQGQRYFSSSNKEHRIEAIKNLLGGFKQDEELFATILRSVCGNYVEETKTRQTTVLEASLTENDLDLNIYKAMFKAINNNVKLFQDFLTFKANLFNTKKLKGEDVEAQLQFENLDLTLNWDSTLDLISKSYSGFDKEIGSIVKDMITQNRIDSKPKPAKVPVAFCAPWYNGKSAFLMLSYDEKLSSAFTLAHELGHGVHAYHSTKEQNFITEAPPPVIAEIASEIGRMLFVDKFISETDNKELIQYSLFQATEKVMNLVFEVSSRVKFEEDVYKTIRDGQYLSAEKVNEIFWNARKTYFGDAVEWYPEQVYQWVWKPHYYIPDMAMRLYNFSYVFAEMIVLVLYNQYKKEGKSFVPKYKELLKAGGAKFPADMFNEIGFDLYSYKFWEAGIDELRNIFGKLKKQFQ